MVKINSMISKSYINRKYYLHKCLRKLQLDYNSGTKTIFIPDNLDFTNYYVVADLVVSYNYSIQYTIA